MMVIDSFDKCIVRWLLSLSGLFIFVRDVIKCQGSRKREICDCEL